MRLRRAVLTPMLAVGALLADPSPSFAQVQSTVPAASIFTPDRKFSEALAAMLEAWTKDYATSGQETQDLARRQALLDSMLAQTPPGNQISQEAVASWAGASGPDDNDHDSLRRFKFTLLYRVAEAKVAAGAFQDASQLYAAVFFLTVPHDATAAAQTAQHLLDVLGRCACGKETDAFKPILQASVLSAAGKLTEAKSALESATAVDPNLNNFLLAEIDEKSQRPEQALARYRSIEDDLFNTYAAEGNLLALSRSPWLHVGTRVARLKGAPNPAIALVARLLDTPATVGNNRLVASNEALKAADYSASHGAPQSAASFISLAISGTQDLSTKRKIAAKLFELRTDCKCELKLEVSRRSSGP